MGPNLMYCNWTEEIMSTDPKKKNAELKYNRKR